MSASPIFLPYPPQRRTERRATDNVWLPAILSIVFIAFTSTTLMSGNHTQFLVSDVWKAFFGNWHLNWIGPVNFTGRKLGHFFGYGAIGLIFRNAWHSTLRSRVMRLGISLVSRRLLIWSAGLSVLSIFLLASLDEFHQHFLPQRVGSFQDVIRDTAGTVFLNLVWLGIYFHNRRKARNA